MDRKQMNLIDKVKATSNNQTKYPAQVIDRLVFADLLSPGTAAISLTDNQQEALRQFKIKLAEGIYAFEEASCLCGSTNDYLIATRDRYGLDLETCLCRECGLLRTKNPLNPESLSGFYDKDYRSIYVGHNQAPDDFFLKQVDRGKRIYDFVSSEIKFASDSKIFDVGCGAGGILMSFKEAGYSTFGCDLGSNYLERGRQEGLLLKHGDISSLSEVGKADLVILSHVLEHFPDPVSELKKIGESIVEGGFLYVEVPGIFAIHKSYGKTIKYLQNAHLYHFTLNTLKFVLAQAGFKLVKGDEHICALFQKSEYVDISSTPQEFSRILNYLYFVEIRNFFFLIRNMVVKTIKYILGDRIVNYLKGVREGIAK